MSGGVKRKMLCISTKVAVIHALEGNTTNANVCKQFDLGASTVSTIWKNRESILKAYSASNLSLKKMRSCNKSDLDEALFKWLKAQRSIGTPINGPILQIQAEKLATELGYVNFKCTDGWISRFKKRHNISFAKVSGEARSVNLHEVNTWITEVWEPTKTEYEDNNIFNIDEAGIFYKLMPDKTFKFKGEKCVGGKLSKERITALVGANATGTEKRKMLIIGKSQKPRCFKNVKNLPVKYKANKSAWMTSDLFKEEIMQWDSEMRKKKRKILLLVDNCPAHCDVPNLSNIKLLFFPANATSVLQPMDMGVIRSLKSYYRKKLVLMYIESLEKSEQKTVSLLNSINMLAESWCSVTPDTIKNCWIKSGLIKSESSMTDNDYSEDFSLSTWLLEYSLNYDVSSIDDYVDIDCEVIVSEIPSDLDIVESISRKKDDLTDDEYDEEDEVPLSIKHVQNAEALDALEILSGYYKTNEVNEAFFNHYSQLKNIVEDHSAMSKLKKQSVITNYFKKVQ